MKYKVKCQKCSRVLFVRGVYERDTNATVLDDNDRGWNAACEHVHFKRTDDAEAVKSEHDSRVKAEELLRRAQDYMNTFGPGGATTWISRDIDLYFKEKQNHE